MSVDTVWQEALQYIQAKVPRQVYDTWFIPAQLDRIEDTTAHIGVPNKFFGDWLHTHYATLLAEAVSTARGGGNLSVNFVIFSKLSARHQEAQVALHTARSAGLPKARRGIQLNPKYTFDNFVVGAGNQFAHAACMAVAEQPGKTYNPLFIYGGVGLGKTHLSHAVGNYVLAHHPTFKVRYLHAAQYISDVVHAYQQKSFDQFKRYYHSLDILLIDDIQFFTGKDRTQEEFFYAFNALIEARKQVIITCDTYPKDIAGIDERLKSRFSWGLTVAVEPPEQEMRVAIILKKAENLNIAISEEVAFFIAKHIRSNVRELEGALKSVVAYARFSGKDISLESAKEALKDLVSAQNRQITIENIQKTVADYYKLKISDLHSKKRSRNIARPRQVAMALARDLTQISLPDIGDAFGNRDHTTVLHACRTIATLREKNTDLNRDYHVLEQVLKA